MLISPEITFTLMFTLFFHPKETAIGTPRELKKNETLLNTGYTKYTLSLSRGGKTSFVKLKVFSLPFVRITERLRRILFRP